MKKNLTSDGGQPAQEARSKPTTSAERAIKDLLVVEMATSGVPWDEIASRDGRSERRLKSIVKAYRESCTSLSDRDPREVAGTALRRADARWLALAEMAMNANNDAIRLGALKAMGQAETQLLQLQQAVGLIPRDLGSLQWLDDVRGLALAMVDALDALERGDSTVADVRAVFAEFVGASPRSD